MYNNKKSIKMKIILLCLPLLALAHMTIAQKKPKKYPTILLKVDIKTSVKKAFEYIVPVELSHIFKRYKNLPGIERTSNKELWYTPGMQRTVYFEDGNTAQEYLLTVNPHTGFSYKIDSFTSTLRRLAKQINGQWVFTESEKGITHIEWSYTIVPKNFLARWMINAFVKKNLRGMLHNALQILKKDLESGQLHQFQAGER